MIENYPDAVQYLYDNLPIFQRIGAAALKPDLTNTIRLCEALGNPHLKFKSIHVAGTNGKGSTSHMLASVLQSAGSKTGLYTSPHLKEFTERIKVNGEEITQQFVVDFVNRIKPEIDRIKPSFFEITVAMAFDYFVKQKVDIAVIEVGLGGRLDSTNVITPLVSVITNIGWDHKDLLGNTLPAIASEKAGIIKKKIPVVISERQGEVQDVFVKKAEEEEAPIKFASDTYEAKVTEKHGFFLYDILKNGSALLTNVKLPLQGLYQRKNLPGVFAAIDVINQSAFSVPIEMIRTGIEKVVAQTGLKGRWQKLSEMPLMICDTGHNIDGVKEILNQISRYKFSKLHMIWGMVKDKDVTDILTILPKDASYYFCEAKIPRAMEASVLRQKAEAVGLRGEVVEDVNDAIRQALIAASENDFIFIGGSTYVVSEIDGL
jgi:dihydrofolate synthase/folylpolyglutamate synthase